MLHRENLGAQAWAGVHVTHRTTVAEIFDVDNVVPVAPCSPGSTCFTTPASPSAR